MRITRHPQAFGQIIWCLAHTLWIGTSFTFITSLGLISASSICNLAWR